LSKRFSVAVSNKKKHFSFICHLFISKYLEKSLNAFVTWIIVLKSFWFFYFGFVEGRKENFNYFIKWVKGFENGFNNVNFFYHIFCHFFIKKLCKRKKKLQTSLLTDAVTMSVLFWAVGLHTCCNFFLILCRFFKNETTSEELLCHFFLTLCWFLKNDTTSADCKSVLKNDFMSVVVLKKWLYVGPI
jgi:hypothetical protein